MPLSNTLEVLIGEMQVDVTNPEEVISLSYKLEDRKDFQTKQSTEALGIVVPASKRNDTVANTFHNPSIEDMTQGKIFREPRPAVIRSGGIELLTGLAFLRSASHTTKPEDYEYSLYGANGDWIIQLKETNLFDCWSFLNFTFTKALIQNSWVYDGTDIDLPYVFAPVRYGQAMGKLASLVDGNPVDDYNMYPEYMKPSLSKYWTIYYGFKLLGYRIQSDFFESEFFRRQVMPWTWGAFLDTDGTRLDILKFRAISSEETTLVNTTYDDFWDAKVSNDSYNGAFDNTRVYEYDAGAKKMKWTYPNTAPANGFGPLNATFRINIFADATIAGPGTEIKLVVYWYLNDVETTFTQFFDETKTPFVGVGRKDKYGNFEDSQTFTVSPGDVVSAKVFIKEDDGGINARANIRVFVDAFETSFFRIPLGGTIDFQNYLGMKDFKFLDFLSGVIDEFDLSVGTDSVNKVVYFEPTHPFVATGNDLSGPSGGYFNGTALDWSKKQDLSKKSVLDNFDDSERELQFKYKDDPNDGTLKKAQDRDNNIRAMAKYVFSSRFKAGTSTMENRFFGPTMHYEPRQWDFDDLGPPQMVVMAPENISNVSAGEAQNTLIPKSCYYKGTTTDWKWVFDGANDQPYPFMFAVNYKDGGEDDPILSYTDELIGDPTAPDDQVVGKGLVRRFFLQRLINMQNGQIYHTYMHLNNSDFGRFLHREHILLQGQKWELIEINDYNPLRETSCQVALRKQCPITPTPDFV